METSRRTTVQCVKIMNGVSIILFIFCILHMLSHTSVAETNTGALSLVPTDSEEGDDLAQVNVVDDLSNEITNDEVFYPTDEWQQVKDGQAIPAGLHVRLNLQTGMREAKLMEGDNGLRYWNTGDKQFKASKNRKQFAANELKKALKDFKTTELDETNLQREEEVKAKFRSYDDLKMDLEEMNVKMQTDGEIITDLFNKLKDKNFETDKFDNILYDLEYHLHKIDGAVLFKDLGGISLLVKLVNSSKHEDVQIEAAMALGSACHSNPQVQIAALEAGGVQVLLRGLSISTSSQLQRKLLFALASICKQFPYAQKSFVELGGVSALRQILADTGCEKLKVKAVTFLNDLVTEKDDLVHLDSNNSSDKEKLRQYKQVQIREALVEHGWCSFIPPLLQVSGHDSREQVLMVIRTLSDMCQDSFIQSSTILTQLRHEYKSLAAEFREHESDDDDKFYTSIVHLIDEIKTSLHIKDEL